MKKKILALISAAAMALTFTACTENGDVESALGGGNSSASFQHGTNTDSGYKSSYFNIEIEYGSDWTVFDDEYMASQNGIDDMSDENVNKALDDSGILYEMMAKMESNSNVNIVVENLNLTNGGKSLSAKEYLEAALPNLKDSLTATYGDVSVDISTVNICGKDLPCIKGSISANGVSANEILVAVSNGKYIATITFTTVNDDDFNTLASAFKSIG